MQRLRILAVLSFLVALTSAVAGQTSAPDIRDQAVVCAGCHGDDGNSKTPLIPSLAAQPEFFLTTQLILMRERVRPVPVMLPFVEKLSDGDIEALAKYFAELPAVKSEEVPEAALVQRGAQLAAQMRCGSCHLQTLAGQEQMPRLAGQRLDYMFDALKAYRDSQRPGADPLMSNAVVGVSDADLLALAHYAASR